VLPFIHLGPLAVPTYGLMLAVGMVTAYFVLRADLERRGIAPKNSDLAEKFIAIPCLAGILGSKLWSVLESPREFLADPVGQLFSQYGFTWFGGLVAGLLVYLYLAHSRKLPALEMLDAASPAAALGYGIGRMGCLLSGDGDYGIPTSLPWGMAFPNGLVPTTERVHPTPIYEFLAACVIAWWLWRAGGRGKPERRGCLFAQFLALTGAARFLVEFIRINPRSVLGLTNAQAASLVSIVAGVALWWRLTKRAPRGAPAEK
jgi:phosphatidylglycerol---prolipoprotein diacylglyceryl transferase